MARVQRVAWHAALALLLLAARAPTASAATTQPAKHKTCASCTAAGFGWSLSKSKCGRGFKNKGCPSSDEPEPAGESPPLQETTTTKAAGPPPQDMSVVGVVAAVAVLALGALAMRPKEQVEPKPAAQAAAGAPAGKKGPGERSSREARANESRAPKEPLKKAQPSKAKKSAVAQPKPASKAQPEPAMAAKPAADLPLIPDERLNRILAVPGVRTGVVAATTGQNVLSGGDKEVEGAALLTRDLEMEVFNMCKLFRSKKPNQRVGDCDFKIQDRDKTSVPGSVILTTKDKYTKARLVAIHNSKCIVLAVYIFEDNEKEDAVVEALKKIASAK